jgi:hypothetical protein
MPYLPYDKAKKKIIASILKMITQETQPSLEEQDLKFYNV